MHASINRQLGSVVPILALEGSCEEVEIYEGVAVVIQESVPGTLNESTGRQWQAAHDPT